MSDLGVFSGRKCGVVGWMLIPNIYVCDQVSFQITKQKNCQVKSSVVVVWYLRVVERKKGAISRSKGTFRQGTRVAGLASKKRLTNHHVILLFLAGRGMNQVGRG